MRLTKWIPRGLLIVILMPGLSGCEGQNAIGPDRELNPANFTNGPPSPGTILIRVEGALSRVLTSDPEAGLVAIHGVTSGFTECNDTTTRVEVDRQTVLTPSDTQAISLLLTGDDNDVSIYAGSLDDLAPFTIEAICAFIATHEPLYEGQVQYQLHINGQNSLRFSWQGFVTETATGDLFHYEERQYLVVHGDGTAQQVVEDIILQPVGGSS